MAQQGAGYYQNNLLTEMAALKARVAVLERALLSRSGGSSAQLAGIAGDTPNSALPPAGDIPPHYFVDNDTGRIYLGVVRTIEGTPRFYLQDVGRVRTEGE